MSYGKMNTRAELVRTETTKDDEGFTGSSEKVLASLRVYKEERHGTERWANRAAFSSATALFRFRRIPETEVGTDMILRCDDDSYRIVSVEDVKGRVMYIEVLAEKQAPTVR